MTPQTHEQAMACLSCGLSGYVPDEHFPQEPGLWDRPCPRCDAMLVWVTEVRASGDEAIEQWKRRFDDAADKKG
jgi:hypothetical protein